MEKGKSVNRIHKARKFYFYVIGLHPLN